MRANPRAPRLLKQVPGDLDAEQNEGRRRSCSRAVLGVSCIGRIGSRQTTRQESTGRTEGAIAVSTEGEPPAFVTRDREGDRLWSLTKQFYQKRDEAPAWTNGRKPTHQMKELIAVLQRADREGLDPALYNAPILDSLERPAREADTDVRLTISIFATHPT